MIGIICATDDELAAILALDRDRPAATVRMVGGEDFHTVALGEAACPAIVTRTQIGKVNAAMAATLMIAHPDLQARALIMIGVGGALGAGLEPGDTVVAVELGCHDYGMVDRSGMKAVRPGDFPPTAPRAVMEPVHPAARRIALDLVNEAAAERPGERLRAGGILCGDLFINSDQARDRLYRDFGADIVDMESYAVFQVARRFDIPLVVLRSASDSAGDEAGQQYSSRLAHNCDRAAGFLPGLLHLIASDRYGQFTTGGPKRS